MFGSVSPTGSVGWALESVKLPERDRLELGPENGVTFLLVGRGGHGGGTRILRCW